MAMNRNRFAMVAMFVVFAAQARAAEVKVIVHSSNPLTSITKSKVGDLFLKRVTRWENGRAVTPVDLSEKSAARAIFCKELLGKEVSAVKSHWQKMIFSGRATPPVELSSDSEVIEFVRNNADAIGYVSEGATLPSALRALSVVD
jgi:ABC-type phosphate transport system substrate-binding protein